ncbi:MAG: GtrA family protein [Anaerolineales bacterium]|nr:GtrA family protein [Anaerolineales bacterium]
MMSTLTSFAGRVGVNPKEAERFLKFAVVGAIGFVVDFGIFNLMINPFLAWLAPGTGLYEMMAGLGLNEEQIIGLAPTFAGTVSFIAAIISNFLWNRYWTYPDSRTKSVRRQLVQFTVVSVAGILIRAPILTFTHRPFTRLAENALPSLAPYAVRIGKNLALMLSVGVVMFWNFFINRYWTYNDVASE